MSNQSVDEKQKNIASLCEQYLQKLINNLKQNHGINGTMENDSTSIATAEIQLWKLLKKYIEASESGLIQRIHGFYVYILQIFSSHVRGPGMDPYFIRCKPCGDSKLKESEKHFLYNIYIRLGDLNRYLKNLKISRSYYSQACEIDPFKGHAYNQLALVTSQVFNSLYYSVRALLATKEPITAAKNNIDSLVNRYSLMNPNIEPLFLNESHIIDAERVENWLHFSIVAVYCDKLKIILPYLVNETDKYLIGDLGKSGDEYIMPEFDVKWTFAALDVACDVMIVQLTDDKISTIELEKELFEMKTKLSNMIKDKKSLSLETTLALKHDFLLNGFSLLRESHKLKDFSPMPPSDQHNIQQLLLRIVDKIDRLLVLLNEKRSKYRTKKSRNIALQSILGSKGSS